MVFAWFSPKMEKRTSAIEGTGLFAKADIAAGELVVMKGGHVMDRAERDRVAKILGTSEIQIDENLFIGPAKAGERGHAMMYLNHSCEPNVGVQGQIAFHAMRDIAVGEELSFDYATGDDDDWSMECSCASEQCRGIVT